MLHLPIPVEPEQQIDGMPYLLSGLDIVRKEATGASISTFIKMGHQHDDRLLSGRRHRIYLVGTSRDVLIAFRIGDGSGDVTPQ